MTRRRTPARRALPIAVVVAMFATACGGTAWNTRDSHTTVAPSTPPPSAITQFRRMATNTLASLESAVADAEPGTPAAQYFAHRLSSQRAYVSVGGHGTPMRLRPIPGGVATCINVNGDAECWEYQHPTYANDDRLSNFTVNGVDVGKLVRSEGTPDLPAAPVELSPGVRIHISSMLRDIPNALEIDLVVDNSTGSKVTLPRSDAFTYTVDGSATGSVPQGWAAPPKVAAHSSAVVSLRYDPANYGGRFTMDLPGQYARIPVPGPPVALKNGATTPA